MTSLRKAGASDLVDKENAELKFLEAHLTRRGCQRSRDGRSHCQSHCGHRRNLDETNGRRGKSREGSADGKSGRWQSPKLNRVRESLSKLGWTIWEWWPARCRLPYGQSSRPLHGRLRPQPANQDRMPLPNQIPLRYTEEDAGFVKRPPGDQAKLPTPRTHRHGRKRCRQRRRSRPANFPQRHRSSTTATAIGGTPLPAEREEIGQLLLKASPTTIPPAPSIPHKPPPSSSKPAAAPNAP